MAIQALALGVNNAPIDTMTALGQGMQARQQFDSNKIKIAQQNMETIGSIALGSMGGNINGQADPKLFEQGLDILENHGIDVSGFRGKPQLAPVAARASMTALQQLGQTMDQAKFDQTLKEFSNTLNQQAVGNNQNQQQIDLATRRVGNDEAATAAATTATADAKAKADADKAKIYELIKAKDPDIAEMFNSGALDGPAAYKALQSKLNPGGPNGVTYGVTPIWGTDKTTNKPVFGLPGSDGSFKQVDTGNVEPKDPGAIAGDKAGAGADAKASAAARAALPATEQNVDNTLKAADAILANAEGLADQFGNTLGIPNQNMPPRNQTPRADMLNQLQQMQGQAFLQIRQSLKGAGQVTDYEGQKGEMAITRAEAAAKNGDLEGFKRAIGDYKDAVNTGMDLLRKAANGDYGKDQPAVTGESPAPTPAAGDLTGATDADLLKQLGM